MTTLFEKIIAGEIPSQKLFENDRIIAIKDINPAAPVHILIIPKKVIPNIQSLAEDDLPLVAEIVKVAQQLALDVGIQDNYRLVTNCGVDAGQTIFHLHFHLVGGRKLHGLG
ncbi:MAG: histidine triad nucleotide-binding protein [Parachlamydiales bacterium]|nr:histidine triad nucleotide-binding protein [Parachlamydiales bacterium]